jgi:hypothetical protein
MNKITQCRLSENEVHEQNLVLSQLSKTHCPFLEPSSKKGNLWNLSIQLEESTLSGDLLSFLSVCCNWFCTYRSRLSAKDKETFCLMITIKNINHSNLLHKCKAQWIFRCALAKNRVLCGSFSTQTLRLLTKNSVATWESDMFVIRSFLPKSDLRFFTSEMKPIKDLFLNGNYGYDDSSIDLVEFIRIHSQNIEGEILINNWANDFIKNPIFIYENNKNDEIKLRNYTITPKQIKISNN